MTSKDYTDATHGPNEGAEKGDKPFPRITSSDTPMGGDGWQWNVEGCGSIIAIITKSDAPNSAEQGEVESLLLAKAMMDDLVKGDGSNGIG